MSRTAGCLFCRIVSGLEPSTKVYEDDRCLAFMDIHPLGTGHVLVIPKHHARKLEQLDESTQRHLFAVCNRIVAAQRRAGLGVDGTHYLLNDGKATNQHVPHVHFHLIPRSGRDAAGFFFRLLLHFTGLFGFPAPEHKLQAVAERIRRQLPAAEPAAAHDAAARSRASVQ